MPVQEYNKVENKTSVHQIVKQLKENQDDYEFYPTTDEMLSVIAPYMDKETVLDIGCGMCHFYEYMKKESENQKDKYGYNRNKIDKYYVIEKSRTLLNKLPDYAICLGTDVVVDSLLDKKVTTIFCNPPYSEFELWTNKILSEGNFKQAFLVIPQRWESNQDIHNVLNAYNTTYDILGSFDFLNGERQARAKVHVVRFQRKKYTNSYRNQDDFNKDALDVLFEKVFNIKIDKTPEYAKQDKKEKTHKENLQNALVEIEGGKAEFLVKKYEEDYNNLMENLKTIMQLDEDLMAVFDLSVNKIKEALISKIKGLRVLYWNLVWDEFEEITTRLTTESRNKIKQEYDNMYTIDFTVNNIWLLVMWVLKNANKYYEEQLISFYKKLSDIENVKPYKSNTKLFENDGWIWSCRDKKDYYLDYRIIMSSPFSTSWHGEFDVNEYSSRKTLNDICVIARNLGFIAGDIILPTNFGEKVIINYTNGKTFMEYRAYKNGNIHVKFDKEFTKAMNVEVARLLGWIRCKEDIIKEFPEDMAKGAEKYFKTSYTCLGNNIKLLTCK